MNKKRFYFAKSMIYGFTVYDRTTQQPAWEYGVSSKMTETKAMMKAVMLNRLDRLGELDTALFREIGGQGSTSI